MFSKAKLRLGLIAIAAGIIVYYFYFRTEYHIESYSSEMGKYVYIVEEYGEVQHRIRKLDMESNDVLWKQKIEINYRLNHQARRNLSPLFFDEKNVYYYIHDISNYHLAAFDKNTGNMKFAVDINKNIKEKAYPALYRPFFNLEDKVILQFGINSRKETLLIVIDKSKGKITNNSVIDISSYSSTPFGLRDINSDFFTIVSPDEISVLNKKDIKKHENIRTAYMFDYLKGNDLYYFNENRQLIRKNLKTGKSENLWEVKVYVIDIFKAKKSFIIYSSGPDNKKVHSKKIQCFNNNGKIKWSYTLPDDYYFYSIFARDNQKYDPKSSVYSYIDYNYFPVILSLQKDNKRLKKILIFERETGTVTFESKLIPMNSASDLISSRIFKYNNKFLIQIKNNLIEVNQDTGKVTKVFSIIYNDEGKDKIYHLGKLMPKNIIDGYLFLRYGRGIVRIDLESLEIKKTGVSNTFRIETEKKDLFNR